jgi:molybdopterin-guanine dinucleotide biosynthesis protein A
MILGAVLAGGSSRRMGRDKAQVTVLGRTMLEHVAGALGEAADLVIVAGRTDLEGLEGVADPGNHPAGPLAGLVAALERAGDGGAGAVVLVAVDQPFVRARTLAHLLEVFDGEAVVPVADGVRQVTCAVYPSAWLDEARGELEAGGSIQSLLDRMPHVAVPPRQWARWGEDGASWFSVDDETALAAGIDRFRSGLE